MHATYRQVSYIEHLIEANGFDVTQVMRDYYANNGFAGMTKRDASSLIDDLKNGFYAAHKARQSA